VGRPRVGGDRRRRGAETPAACTSWSGAPRGRLTPWRQVRLADGADRSGCRLGADAPGVHVRAGPAPTALTDRGRRAWPCRGPRRHGGRARRGGPGVRATCSRRGWPSPGPDPSQNAWPPAGGPPPPWPRPGRSRAAAWRIRHRRAAPPRSGSRGAARPSATASERQRAVPEWWPPESLSALRLSRFRHDETERRAGGAAPTGTAGPAGPGTPRG